MSSMTRRALFGNRMQAGKMLARHLDAYAHRPDVIVLALPRGGVPIGFAVAEALHAPLDILVVRKLGVPWHEEYAMGAVASGGVRVLQNELVARLRIPADTVDEITRREMKEIERREHCYRSGRPAPALEGRTVILVDDGLATGSTMLAAVRAVRQSRPEQLVVAVPVGAADACQMLAAEADEVICPHMPSPFQAVGIWYEDFAQTGDEEVIRLLDDACRRQAHHPLASGSESPGGRSTGLGAGRP